MSGSSLRTKCYFQALTAVNPKDNNRIFYDKQILRNSHRCILIYLL